MKTTNTMKNMNIGKSVVALLALCAANAFAADVVDLSGTWRLSLAITSFTRRIIAFVMRRPGMNTIFFMARIIPNLPHDAPGSCLSRADTPNLPGFL